MHQWRDKDKEISRNVSSRQWDIMHDAENNTKNIVDSHGLHVVTDYESSRLSDHNAEHIIKCVNAYEPAIKEIERLQDVITQLMMIKAGEKSNV